MRRASLAVVVVLPEPWRPTIRNTAGGETPVASSASPPRISTKWSWTSLTTIWPGVTERRTSWPTAFSRTPSMKVFTTGSATSASSNATRTSRSAAVTSASVSAPRRFSRSKTCPSRLVSPSNTSRNAPRMPKLKAPSRPCAILADGRSPGFDPEPASESCRGKAGDPMSPSLACQGAGAPRGREFRCLLRPFPLFPINGWDRRGGLEAGA